MKITTNNKKSMNSSPKAVYTGFIALFFLIILGGLAGCDEKKDEQQAKRPPVEVGVVTLHKQSVNLTAELPGRTTASIVSEVRPQVDGIILQRLFKEGTEVKEGDILYKIDPSTYQAEYDTAVASLRQAQAELPSAESRAKRDAKLVKHNAVSSQDYEDAKAAFEAAKAAVATAKARVKSARINLDHTNIKAPISGRIEKSTLTPGALVTANQATALTTIRCLDPINVDLTQSSTSFLNLRREIASGRIKVLGEAIKVKLRLENGEFYPIEGDLKFSEANVDEDTGTYTIRAEFPNPDRLLLPGMYVRAIVTEGVVSDGFLLPQLAVTRNIKGEPIAMFVDKDGKVEQRVILVRRDLGNNWLVESGVNDGDRVVVKGLQFISQGQTVKTKQMVVDEETGEVKPKEQAASSGTEDVTGNNSSVKGVVKASENKG